MRDERDFRVNPYSEDEKRVAAFIAKITDGAVGGGEDPIGFLIASHDALREYLRELRMSDDQRRPVPGKKAEPVTRSDYDTGRTY